MTSVAQAGFDAAAYDLKKARAVMNDRRFDEHRVHHVAAWRHKTTGRVVNGIQGCVTALEDASRGLSGKVCNEADIRGYLAQIADALRAELKAIEADVRESVVRESDSNRHAA
jgi:hypothetical protein